MSVVNSCKTCKYCHGDVLNEFAKCAAVVEPLSGTPLAVSAARMDTYLGYKMPCGYAGALWEGKS